MSCIEYHFSQDMKTINHSIRNHYWRENGYRSYEITSSRISSTVSKARWPRSLQAWRSSCSEREATPSFCINISSSFILARKRDKIAYKHIKTPMVHFRQNSKNWVIRNNEELNVQMRRGTNLYEIEWQRLLGSMKDNILYSQHALQIFSCGQLLRQFDTKFYCCSPTSAIQ